MESRQTGVRQMLQRIMSKGYDGEYYTEADEQIEDDY